MLTTNTNQGSAVAIANHPTLIALKPGALAVALLLANTWLLGGCISPTEPEGSRDTPETEVSALTQELTALAPTCDPAALSGRQAKRCRAVRRAEGKRLFDEEEFGGNGRTCLTCHSTETGTLSPEDVQARLANPGDALFVHDALDDDGLGTSRLEADATIRVSIPLPPYVTLADDPSATHITVFRGVAGTLNTPGLDPVLMQDGREPTLESQALGAIQGHAQNTVDPTANELELIADFQQTSRRFFSSRTLRRFAAGGPLPSLPEGRTASEKRGREFFVDAPFEPPSKVGVCGLCHSGPLLNETNVFGAEVFPAPVGARFHAIHVEKVNRNNYPVQDLLVDDGLGNIVPVSTADPGMLLIPGLLPPPGEIPRNVFSGFFKTPQLWGVSKTGPYFHDNSAKTLEEAVEHYQFFFDTDAFTADAGIVFTEQDIQDIVAFMELL